MGQKDNGITDDGPGMTIVLHIMYALIKMKYGNKLNPDHSLRTTRGTTGTKQKVIFKHNSSEINQNQLLFG